MQPLPGVKREDGLYASSQARRRRCASLQGFGLCCVAFWRLALIPVPFLYDRTPTRQP